MNRWREMGTSRSVGAIYAHFVTLKASSPKGPSHPSPAHPPDAHPEATRDQNSSGAGTLSGAEAEEYRRAVRVLTEAHIRKPLWRVAEEFVRINRGLNGMTLAEALELVAERRRLTIAISVPGLVEAFLGQNHGEAHPGARVHLRHFSSRFGGELSQVNAWRLQEWFDDLAEEVSEDTQRAHLVSVTSLFSWARRRRYWPYNEPLPTDTVRVGEHHAKGREDLISPADFQTIMTAACVGLRRQAPALEVPLFLALSGLAGLRRQEIGRLEWMHIDLDGQRLRVAAHGRRPERSVSFGNALRAWIQQYLDSRSSARPGALVIGTDTRTLAAETLRLADRLQIFWPVNAPRNSWIAHSLALAGPGGEEALATAAGLPAATLHRHYHQLVSSEEAGFWFAISPDWCAAQ